jgi:hypothetical protein
VGARSPAALRRQERRSRIVPQPENALKEAPQNQGSKALVVEAKGSGHGFLQQIELDPKAKSDGDLPSRAVPHDPPR